MVQSRLLVCALFGMLAACGGGGDGAAPAPVAGTGVAGAPPAPAPIAPPPAPVPAPAPAPVEGGAAGPTPTPTGTTFTGGAAQQANTTTAGDQAAPLIAAIAGGGYVVTWNSGQGPLAGVHGQRFAADGARLGGEFEIFASRLPTRTGWTGYQGGGLATLANGSLVASASSSWVEAQAGPASAVHVQRFDASGTLIGPQVMVGSPGNYDTAVQAGPVFARADGGFSVIVFHVGRPTPRTFVDTYLHVFDAEGQPVGTPVHVSADGPGPAGIAQLRNGNILLAWTRFSPRGRSLGWAMVTGTGAPVAAVDRPFLPDAESFAAGVTALENGNVVITWTQEVPGAPDKVLGQVVDPAGNAVGGEFELPAAGQVTGLSSGGFVLTWLAAGGELFAQHFDASGAASGNAVRIDAAVHAPVSASWQAQPYELLATAGGGFVLASQERSEATGVDVQVQAFQARAE